MVSSLIPRYPQEAPAALCIEAGAFYKNRRGGRTQTLARIGGRNCVDPHMHSFLPKRLPKLYDQVSDGGEEYNGCSSARGGARRIELGCRDERLKLRLAPGALEEHAPEGRAVCQVPNVGDRRRSCTPAPGRIQSQRSCQRSCRRAAVSQREKIGFGIDLESRIAPRPKLIAERANLVFLRSRARQTI